MLSAFAYVTTPEIPTGERFASQYGMVTLPEWLNREKERINLDPDGRAVLIHFEPNGAMSLVFEDMIANATEERA